MYESQDLYELYGLDDIKTENMYVKDHIGIAQGENSLYYIKLEKLKKLKINYSKILKIYKYKIRTCYFFLKKNKKKYFSHFLDKYPNRVGLKKRIRTNSLNTFKNKINFVNYK